MSIIFFHFVAGLMAALYQLRDIKRSRQIDDIDYILLFGTICFGYISFVVMVSDIYQCMRWWK